MPARVNKGLLFGLIGGLVVVAIVLVVILLSGSSVEEKRQKTLALADEYREKGDAQQEVFLLEGWINEHADDDPQIREIRLRLARLFEELRQIHKAGGQYAQILKIDPNNLEALLKLAEYALRDRSPDFESAARHANAALMLDPQSVLAQLYFAQASLALEKYTDATVYARSVIKNAPKQKMAYLVLCDALRKRADLEPVKAKEEALQVLNDGLAANPGDSDIAMALAMMMQQAGKTEEAKKILDDTLKNVTLTSESGAVGSFEAFRANMAAASFHEQQEDWDKAERYYRLGVDNATDLAMQRAGRKSLGVFYYRRQRMDDALAQFDKALAIDRNPPDVLLLKARILMGQDKMDDARKCLDEVLSRDTIDGFYIDAMQLDGRRLIATGGGDKGIQKLENALKLAHDRDIEANLLDIRAVLGESYLRLNEFKKARTHLQIAYGQMSNNWMLKINLAKALFGMQEYDQVIALLRTGHNRSDGFELMSMAHSQLGDYREAYLQMAKAVALAEENAALRLKLSRLGARLKRYDVASKQAGEVERLAPAAPDAWMLRAGICELMAKDAANDDKDLTRRMVDAALGADAPPGTGKALEKPLLALADRYYLKALDKAPDNDRLLMGYAVFLNRQGRPADGEKALQDAIQKHADQPKRWEDLLLAYYWQIADLAKARELYRARAEADPRDVVSREQLVTLALSSRDAEDASRWLTEVKVLEPDSVRTMRIDAQCIVSQAQDLMNKAREARGNNDPAAADDCEKQANAKYKEALAILEKAHDKDKENAAVRYYMGSCYLRLNHPTKAVEYLEPLSESFSSLPRLKHDLMEAYYRTGQFAESGRLSRELESAGAGSIFTDMVSAQSNLQLGKPEEGESYWRQVLKERPSMVEAWLGLGDSLLMQGRERWQEATDVYRKAYELDGRSFRSLSRLVNAYIRQSKLQDALVVTEEVAALDDKNTAVLALLAQLYTQTDQPDKAKDIYARLKAADPNDPLPLLAEGEAAMKANDLKAAETSFRQALALQTDNDRTRRRLVEILLMQKRNDEAIALVDQALAPLRARTERTQAEAARYATYLQFKSRVRLLEGNAVEGIDLLRQAIAAANEGNVTQGLALLHYELATVYLRVNPPKVKEAEAELNAALAAAPNFAQARLQMVALLIASKRWGDAEVQCLQLLEDGPNVIALLTLGDIAYNAKNDPAKAEEYYRRAIDAFPTETRVHQKMAEFHFRTKQTDKAIVAMEKAIETADHSPDLVEVYVRTLIAQDRQEKAIEICQKQIKEKRNEPLMYLLMGIVEGSRNRHAEARRHLETAREKGGDKAVIHFELARSYEASEEYEKALEEAREALKMQPRLEAAYQVIEGVYKRQSRIEDLEKLYAEWLPQLPSSIVAVNNYAWFLIETKKDADRALKVIAAFREKVARGQRDFPFASSLADTEGWALYNKGDYQGAIDLFSEAIKGDRRLAAAYEHRSLAYRQLMKTARDRLTAERYSEAAAADFKRARELMPENAALQQQLGDARLAEGKFSEALKAYDASLKIEENADLRRKVVELLIRDGRLEEAQEHLKKLIAADKAEPKNLVLDGMLKSAQGEHDQAIQLLEAVVKVHPDLHTAHYVLAGEYFVRATEVTQQARQARDEKERDKLVAENRRLIEKGREALDACIKLQPEFLGARLLKARLAVAEQRFDLAIEEVQKVLEIDPNNFEAAFNLGNFYVANNEVPKAEAQFEKMVEKWPGSVAAKVALANVRFRLLKKFDKALEGYREAQALDPKSPQILRGIATILLQLERDREAIQAYQEYLKANESNGPVWIELSGLQERAKMLPAAELSLQKAIETAKTRLEPRVTLVQFYLRNGRADDARSAAQDIVRNCPSEADKLQGRVLVAQTYEAEQNYDKAIENYREIVRDAPKAPFAVNNLAWLLLTRKDQPDEAIRLGEPLLKDNPGFAELYDTVAWAYHAKKDDAKAEPLLRQAVQAKRAQGILMPTLEMHLAEVLVINGKDTEAKVLLERLVKLKFPEQKRAEELLRSVSGEN